MGFITDITFQVQVLNDGLEETLGLIGDTEKASAATLSSTTDFVATSQATIEGAIASFGDSLDTAQSDVLSMTSSISEEVERVEQKTTQSTNKARQVLDDLFNNAADGIDDLEALLAGVDSGVAEELRLQIELIKLGIIDVNDLSTDLLDVQLGAESVREILDGIDPERRRREIRELTKDIQDGSASMSEALAVLEGAGDTLGKRVAEWVKQLADNEITIGQLRKNVEALKREIEDIVGPGGDAQALQDLLDALLDQAKNEQETG